MNTEGIGGDGGDGGGGERQPTPERRQGSPFAKELDERLKSNEPLSSVVAWWRKIYREWREQQKAAGVPRTRLSENESTVLGLAAVYSASPSNEDLTENIKDPDVQHAWPSQHSRSENFWR